MNPEIKFDHAEVPNNKKRLRACLGCKLIKQEEQFSSNGCDNCLTDLRDPDTLRDNTTTNFSGMISLLDSEISWVAKYTHLNGKMRGLYAIDAEHEWAMNAEEDEQQQDEVVQRKNPNPRSPVKRED